MKRSIIILGAAGLVLISGCGQKPQTEASKTSAPPAPPQAELWLRCHFVGTDALAANTNAAKLKTIAELPATQSLRQKTIQRIAGALPLLLWQTTNATAAEKIAPLLDDLCHAELYVEARGYSNSAPVWTLALQLNSERAGLWQTNWRAFFAEGSGANPKDVQVEGYAGWESVQNSNLAQLVRAGQWVVLSWGPESQRGDISVPRQIKSSGRPAPAGDAWLEVEADLPRFAQWRSLSTPMQLPRITLAVNGKAGELRTRATCRYASPVAWQLDAWQIPTNTIQDPVNSFTAVRGIAPWLKEVELFKKLGLEAPNQLYLWAQSDLAYQSYAAFPQPGAALQIKQMPPRIEQALGAVLKNPGGGKIVVTTNNMIVWSDVVVALKPFIRAAKEPGDNFILAGVFPVEFQVKPLPAELLAQVTGKTNLLYYDWEITQPRIDQLRQTLQLALMFSAQPPFPGMTPGDAWATAVAPFLGNTITEATVVSPLEVIVVRQSHLGVTAVELLLLTYWLDSPAFPKLVSPFTEPSPPVPPNTGNPGKKP